MTKQEAMDIIKRYVDQDDDMYTGYRENNEALKIAILCIEWVKAFENISDDLYTGSKADWSSEDD